MIKNIIIIVILIIIIGLAVLYIRKSKKTGIKCIGCPDSKNCNGNCNACAIRKISEE